MFATPVRLPQFSNREDLQFTVSIFDDDTGGPVLLSGITQLSNANGFTGNNWKIVDGQINTTSTTTFTVPGYPVSNQLLTTTWQVGLGLGILPGDPISITDVAGNATMIGYVLSYVPATGTLVVQIGYNFQLEIRSFDRRGWVDDYSPWYDWGGGPPPGGDQPIIIANLTNGLSIIDLGYVQVNIPGSLIQQLRHRTYLIAMGMTDSVNTRQIFLGELPMLYGGMQTLPWSGAVSTAQAV